MEPDDPTVTQCVITVDDPASLLHSFDGQAAVWWLLREFIRFGVSEFILLTGPFPAGTLVDLPCRVRITMSQPTAQAGLGGALLQVRDRLHDRFLLCAGISLLDCNLAVMLAEASHDAQAAVGRMVQFAAAGGMVGVFRKDLLDHLRPDSKLQAEVLPALVRHDLVKVMTAPEAGGGCRAVGDKMPDQSVWLARSTVNPLRRRALLLDRDGVLNVDHGYVGGRERFEWMDGALAAIRLATEAGWHVFIVTNQSGVARGLYTEDAVRDLLRWMAGQARAAGGTIDDMRFCPYHPQALVDRYRQAHPWRKPLPGMLLDLLGAWGLVPEQAVMIGDQDSDMRAAAAAGVAGQLFRGGDLMAFVRPILQRSPPARVADSGESLPGRRH